MATGTPTPIGTERALPPLRRARSVLELIGNTPLVRICAITRDLPPGVRIYAKLEGVNPGGSIKDRPARRMIEKGLEDGLLVAGKTIIDSTSGNTGIALAMIGAALGYPVELVMPENASTERKLILQAYGATITFSSGLEGSDGAILLCREIIKKHPVKYFKPDQYFNEANADAHFRTTGPEIWEQTGGAITHFVTGIGTGGTVMGTGRFLKSQNPAIQIIAIEPDDAFHGLEGMKHMASSIVPGIYHEAELDAKLPVSTEAAYDMVHRIGNEEGLSVGQSSGANLVGAMRTAEGLTDATIVTTFCDSGSRYLSTALWP